MIGCQIPAFCPLNFNHLDCNPRSQELHRNYTRLVNFEITNPQITIVTESSRKSIQSHFDMCAVCQTISLFLSLTPPILNLRDEGRLKASESPPKIRSAGVFVKHDIDWDKLRTPILMNLSARESIFETAWNPSLPKVNSPDCQGLNLRSQMVKPSPK